MKKLFTLLLLISVTTLICAQDFEIRTQEDYSTNFIQVRIRNTQNTWRPTTSTTIDSINFVIRWPQFAGEVASDLELVCTNYNIIDRYETLYSVGTTYNTRFYTTSGSFTCPENWVRNRWYTIATFRAVYTGYNLNWPFYAGPDGWLVDPAGDPVWAQNNTQIDHMDRLTDGEESIVVPSVYTYTWVGGDNTYDPAYDEWSWNNPLNWVNMCGRHETRPPDRWGHCIIPGTGVTDYPKYSKPGNLAYKETALSYTTIVENGGEINWTGAAIPNDTVSTLWVDGPLIIEDGGYVNIGYYGLIRTVEVTNTTVSGYHTYVEGSNGLDVDYYGWLQTFNLDITADNAATASSHGWYEVYGVPFLDQTKSLTIKADENGVGNFVNPLYNMVQSGGSSEVQTFVENSAAAGFYYLHNVGPTVSDPAYETLYSSEGVFLQAFDLDIHGTFAYLYDEPNNDWLNIWPYEYPLPTTTGMLLSTRDATDYTMAMEGFLLENTISTNLRYSNGHLELISNPYPSSIFWDEVYDDNSSPSRVSNSVRVLDPTGGNGNYRVYQAGGTGTFSGVIQVGQGFFVETTSSGTFNFEDDQRFLTDEPFYSPNNTIYPSRKQAPVERTQTNTSSVIEVSTSFDFNELTEREADLYHLEKSQKRDRASIDIKDTEKKMKPSLARTLDQSGNRDIFYKLHVSASGNGYGDEMIIAFRDESLKEFDEMDAEKWNSPHTDATQISSLSYDNIELTINSLPFDQNEMLSIPVSFKCGANETYTLEFKGLDSFDTSTEIWLQDNLQDNDWINITMDNNLYEFTANQDDPNDRFTIHFFGPTGIDDKVSSDKNPVNIYSSGNNLYVIPDAEETINEIVIYNILGSEITRVNNISRSMNKLTLNATTGYYVVRVLTDKNVYSEKVFIKK